MSPFARIFTFLLVAGVGLLGGGGLILYLAYGVEKGPPAEEVVEGLAAPVQIGWGRHGLVSIQAQQERDAMTALGYVHGRRRAWSVALWRQAAAGQLSAWFGQEAQALDRLARRLELAGGAQAAYTRLDAEDRALLDAYADGLQAGLQRQRRLQPEFLLLDVEPEPWEPWHSLAVERLFAWLAAPPPTPEQRAAAGAGATAFYEADDALRRWLQLHGFENSIAWAARDSAGIHLFQRRVYGATALPFLLETSMHLQDGTTILAASLPGTPFFPAGRSTYHAWSLLLTSNARLERAAWDSTGARLAHARIVNQDGAEHLASFWRLPDRLPLEAPSESAADSVWVVRWAGLTEGSDLPAWRALWTGRRPVFRLFEGNGLWVARDGTWQVLGTPLVEASLPAGVFVGSTPWSSYAAELLRTQAFDPVTLRAWIDDAYSIWAAETAPPLIAALTQHTPGHPAFPEALTYLRNWDFAYDRASIAASIFDTWMSRHQNLTGALPGPAAPDSAATRALVYQTLDQALDTLSRSFGDDLSQWRWERVQPNRRPFPIWSVEALQGRLPGPSARTRYAPVELPGRGHPSALAWGASPVQHTLPAPAMWEAWLRTDAWNTFTLRRPAIDPNALFGRYLISDRPTDPISLTPAFPTETATTLTPPGR